MTTLVWDEVGQRLYETGVDRAVFYPRVGDGVAWNGLISVEEADSGGELTPLYYDGIKYLDILGAEDFQASLTAFSAPQEFDECDGIKSLALGLYATQQPRKTFHLSYRTLIGSDTNPRLGYKIHLVYNATASPSGRSSKTITDNSEPETRTWTIDTVPSPSVIIKPTAHLVINSILAHPGNLQTLENNLYGWHQDPDPEVITIGDLLPHMPTQSEVVSILDYGSL